MIALPNGCSRSNIYVYPKNWKSNKASTKKDWLIQYRFYDPATKGTADWGKDIPIKGGINRYHTLEERQEIMAHVLQNEITKLKEGWNPITKVYVTPQSENLVSDIPPQTALIKALTLAEPRVNVVDPVHRDMRSIIKAIDKAAGKLFDQQNHCKYNTLPVYKIESRHIIYLMEQCRKDNDKLSDKRYNKYIAYLSMIFNTLKSLQAIGSNPCDNIDKKKTVTKKRLILTDKEFETIDQHLRAKDYHYWRYMHIFFRSGSRNTEMMQVKKEQVDLEKQEFIVLVKKGSQYEEQVRVINNAVIDLWRDAWNEATPGQHLFGQQFRPSDKPYYDRAAGQYWQDYVKIELGIKKDFYPLKHKYEDLIDAKLGTKHAMDAAGHKNIGTTRIYTVTAEQRRREELKQVDIKLTG